VIRAALSPALGENLFEVSVAPAAGLEQRKYTTGVTLTPVLATGERLPAVSVPVVFEVGEDVQPVPAFVQFGGREVGREARDVISFRSVGGRSFRVCAHRAEGNGLTTHPVERDGLTLYEVVWSATSAGPFDGRLVFAIEAGGESFEVVVPVHGFGYRVP
jgi:hypothetical protein